MDTIVCPIDFSEASRHAATYALAIARYTRARSIALHVCESAAATIHERLRNQFGTGQAPRPEIIAEVSGGEPAAVIAERAHAHDAKVVLGTRGDSGLRHLVLGSVTEQVVRTSPMPVFSASPHAPSQANVPFERVLFATDFSASSLAALSAALRIGVHPAADITVLHVIDEADENALFVSHVYDVRHHTEALETSVREIFP
ncbi:MAG TPA: universal stress protein [Vicinamibacterales bacterium]|jgi:nucleotide-binding universal stress UspA family protein